MSKLRWELNDGGRVHTLVGEIAWPSSSGRQYISGQPVGYVYEDANGWVVCRSGDCPSTYITTLDNLDEAKALLQTICGASNV